MNNYYIYLHINPLTNQIFYVGKGKNKRAFDKKGRNSEWKSIVSEFGLIVDIIENNLSNDIAYEREKFYIKRIGRDNLVNKNDGGNGISHHSEETKKILSEIHKEKPNKYWLGKERSQSTKEKISINTKGKPKNITNENRVGKKHSEETKRKIGEKSKGRKLSNETKQKISESKKGVNNPNYNRVFSDEYRLKLSLAKKGIPKSEETKAKMRLSWKNRKK